MKQISRWLRKNLVKGNSRGCIRNGFLHFNRIEIKEKEVNLFHKTKMVFTITIDQPVNFSSGETLTFMLTDGTMKIELS